MMERLLHQNLTHRAGLNGNHIAVQCGGDVLTYAQLDRQSTQLAAWLIRHGLQPGDTVAVRLPPCVQSMVSVYGILKAGGVLVAIDPKAPAQRLAQLLRAGETKILISDNLELPVRDELADHTLVESGLIVGLTPKEASSETGWWSYDEIEFESRTTTLPARQLDDPAYVIFTSGSTGSPKGIIHTHRSGGAYARLSLATYGIRPDDVVANFSPLHFDMSTLGYFTAIASGATTLFIPPAYGVFPASLSSLIESSKVTIWYSVPFAIVQLLERGVLEKRNFERLRWVLYGGEPLAPKHAKAFAKHAFNATFSNVYGPAEVNQCTFFHFLPCDNDTTSEPSDSVGERSFPIGKTWAETQSRVVDTNDCLVEPGEVGELQIQSSTMMQRYWDGEPDDPKTFWFDPNSGHRYYRTGDLVRERTDGNLDFLGRADRQVKIRGYRIELDEIESAALAITGISEAAAYCVGRDDHQELHLAIIFSDPSASDLDGVRVQLLQTLPRYAVPEQIISQTTFPKTTSGKIDRKAIANPTTLIAQ